jgi:hypothetical protein
MDDRPGGKPARGIVEDLRPLFTPAMVAFAWLPCMAIALLHYRTGPELAWVHDVLRRLFYLPILLAAFSAGLRGGVAISIFASLIYFPHAFTMLLGHDPGDALEKGLRSSCTTSSPWRRACSWTGSGASARSRSGSRGGWGRRSRSSGGRKRS